jgi:hypothetical protein
MRLRTILEVPEENGSDEESHYDPMSAPELQPEAIVQIKREAEAKREIEAKQEDIQKNETSETEALPIYSNGHPKKRRGRMRRLVELGKSQRTTQLLIQIWQSDYSIIAFVIMMGTFYLMKDTREPIVGLTFFLFAMAEVDAILSIFVVRLSFHQNKHGFYRTEDFERDWLRYRMLLSMTKAALLFVVATSCGTVAVIASYLMWFFTTTQRLRYIILRWSMDEHYPELQRWSIFALLREAGVEPKLKNFNVLAALGLLIGYGIVLIF